MSAIEEASVDNAECLKMQRQHAPLHGESSHRSTKIAGIAKPRPRWGNSDMNAKNSEWLQENFADVDAKVHTVLKFLEEDADSSAKPANTYCARRTELVNLVEEFYQKYRALAERCTFLASDLHQNTAPALEAQSMPLHVADIPGDLHGRSEDGGINIDSLASYMFQGGPPLYEDVQSASSSPKAPDDIEDAPSASSTASSRSHGHISKASSTSSEDELSLPLHDSRGLRIPADAVRSVDLKEKIKMLEHEKAALIMKSRHDEEIITHMREKLQDGLAMHITSRTSLDSEESGLNLKLLESEIACIKDENKSLSSCLKETRLEKTSVEEENDRLKVQLQAAILELEGKERVYRNLQSNSGRVQGQQEEPSQQEAQNQQSQRDAASQPEMDEQPYQFQEERNAGNKFADVQWDSAGHFKELEDAMGREQERMLELMELSSVVESLKQSLAVKELENTNLTEDLQSLRDYQSVAEKRYTEEVSFHRSEELKWRTEAADTSTLLSEKVAILRKENAALHKDLSVKIELVLNQQKELESLTEEFQNVSQALQSMSAEMFDLRSDLEICKDVVIPSMEERAVDLQNEIQDLTISNERYVDEIHNLRALLESAATELLLVQERNTGLETELIVNVEMLKHSSVLFETTKAESKALHEKIGLQEEQAYLEQMLATATEEKLVYSNKLASAIEERDRFATEVKWLIAMLANVEQLQRKLASARVGALPDRQQGINMEIGAVTRAHEQNAEPIQRAPGGPQDSESDLSRRWDVEGDRISSSGGKSATLTANEASGLADSDASRSSSSARISSFHSVIERLGDQIQELIEENFNLREQNKRSEAEAGTTRMELSHLQNIVTDLEASTAILQKKNGHLILEVNSRRKDIMNLQDQLMQLQQTHARLLQDVEASSQEKRKSEETLRMLDGVVGSLECSNRRLQADKGIMDEELKTLQGMLADVHTEGAEVVAHLKVKMNEALDQLKTTIVDCGMERKEHGSFQLPMDIESLNLFKAKQKLSAESSDEEQVPELTAEPAARNRYFLTELQGRVKEADMLVEVLLGMKNMLAMLLSTSSEHGGDMPVGTEGEKAIRGKEGVRIIDATSIENSPDLAACVEQHIRLTEHMRQAFIDKNLEREFRELKEGRRQLLEDLAFQSDEVQNMELELQKLDILISNAGSSKEDVRLTQEERKSTSRLSEESVKELRRMLAQQRAQISRMREETLTGEKHRETPAKEQVTVLVSMDSAPTMDDWDEKQLGMLSEEVDSLRSLNRRHSAELRTISEDLQRMGSLVKSAHGQLLQYPPEDDEIVSVSDLKAQKSGTGGLRAQDSRVSTDSSQQLLFASPEMAEGDFRNTPQMSEGSPGQFPLKPRNFGFTWFMLLFSPDRKLTSVIRGRTGKQAASPSLRESRRSGRANAALVVDGSRRKAASCWSCVSSSGRLESFDYR